MNYSDAHKLYNEARQLADAGNAAAALPLFERSASLAPHFKTLELLGECLIALGRLQDAVVPLAAATALNDQSRAPARLADLMRRLGDVDAAVRFARLALQRAPDNKSARQLLHELNVDDRPPDEQ